MRKKKPPLTLSEQIERDTKVTFWLSAARAILVAVAFGFIGWIAAHFINKFW